MLAKSTLLAATLVAGVASSADAAFLRFLYTGEFEVIAASATDVDYSFDFVVVGPQIGGFGITSGAGTAKQTFAPGPDGLDAIFVIEGPSPLDTMTIELAGFLVGPPGAPHGSFAGDLTITAASGAFAGLFGVGDMSGSMYFTSATGGLMDGVVQLDVVPAPASLALLASAGLVALRRRR